MLNTFISFEIFDKLNFLRNCNPNGYQNENNYKSKHVEGLA